MATCSSDACHPKGGKDNIYWKGIFFHHSTHQKGGQDVLSSSLQCDACHSLSLAPGHATAVDTKACFACHLKGQMLLGNHQKSSERACLTCHSLPKSVDLNGGAVANHGKFAASGLTCNACHPSFSIEDKIGSKSCMECHKGMEKPDFRDLKKLHRVHLKGISLSCVECHKEIRHILPSPWDGDFSKEAESCSHAGGITSKGKQRAFIRIECSLCHVSLSKPKALNRERCTLCHEKKGP